MGEASIQRAGKRSPLKRLDQFQVFNTKRLHARKINLTERLTNQAFDLGMCVFLAFREGLNPGIQPIANNLPIGKHEPLLVVGIHSNHIANVCPGWTGLVKHEVYEQPLATPAEPDRLAHRPPVTKESIDDIGRRDRDNKPWRTRSYETDSPIKASAYKRLDSDKVGIQRRDMTAQLRPLDSSVMRRAHYFFCLLCQGLAPSA